MLPKQRIPDSEKTEEWGISCVEYLIRNSDGNTMHNEITRRKRNYNLVNGIHDDTEYEYLTGFINKADGQKLEYPAQFRNFNIIKPVVETIKGEYILRNIEYDVLAHNESAVNERRDIVQHLKVKQEMKKLNSLYASLGFAEADAKDYAGIEQEFVKKGSKIHIEMVTQKILSSLYKKLSIKQKLIEGNNDLIIVDAVVFKIEGGEGWVDLRRVNTLDIYFLMNKDSTFLHDSYASAERRYMSANDVLDYYDEFLTEAQKDTIATMKPSDPVSTVVDGEYNVHNRRVDQVYNFTIYDCYWRSFTEVYKLETTEESGRKVFDVLTKKPEKLGKNQELKRTWMECIWQGTRIDNGIYCKMQRVDVEYRKIDEINHCELPYTGIISTQENCIPISVVDIGSHYQYLYNCIWIKLQHEIASAIGKVIKLDMAQLPRSKDISLEMWLYYLKSMKIYLFNSLETDEQDNRSNYNQMGAEDLSISSSINQYLTILEFIRTEYERAAGVPPQRQGSVHQSETKGGIERSITQSSAITEWLNYIYGQVSEHVLRKLIHQFQFSYKDGKTIQYMLPNSEIGYIDYNPDELSNYDIDVYIMSTGEVGKYRQKLEEATMFSLQSGRAEVTDILSIMRSNSLSEIEDKLKKAIAEKADREQKMAQEQMKSNAEVEKNKLALEREKISAQIKIKEMDRKTKLELADKEIQYQLKLNDGELNQRQAELYATQSVEKEKQYSDIEKELSGE